MFAPKSDILAHVLDVTHGKINTYPIISVIQSRDIVHPFDSDIPNTPTAMAITDESGTFHVYMILLTDDHAVSVDDCRIIGYGERLNYGDALQTAIFYGTNDK